MTPAELREAREAWGLTQQQMAGELGVTQPALSMMEAGTRPITPRTLRALDMARQIRDAARLAPPSAQRRDG